MIFGRYCASAPSTEPDRRGAHAVRHKVYCELLGYEPPRADGLEIDAYDPSAHPGILRHLPSDKIVGAVRIITENHPAQKVSSLAINWRRAGEISRFCILPEHRNFEATEALIDFLKRRSRDLGLKYWVALMEPALLRLLRQHGVSFAPASPKIDHHGERLVGVVNLRDIR